MANMRKSRCESPFKNKREINGLNGLAFTRNNTSELTKSNSFSETEKWVNEARAIFNEIDGETLFEIVKSCKSCDEFMNKLADMSSTLHEDNISTSNNKSNSTNTSSKVTKNEIDIIRTDESRSNEKIITKRHYEEIDDDDSLTLTNFFVKIIYELNPSEFKIKITEEIDSKKDLLLKCLKAIKFPENDICYYNLLLFNEFSREYQEFFDIKMLNSNSLCKLVSMKNISSSSISMSSEINVCENIDDSSVENMQSKDPSKIIRKNQFPEKILNENRKFPDWIDTNKSKGPIKNNTKKYNNPKKIKSKGKDKKSNPVNTISIREHLQYSNKLIDKSKTIYDKSNSENNHINVLDDDLTNTDCSEENNINNDDDDINIVNIINNSQNDNILVKTIDVHEMNSPDKIVSVNYTDFTTLNDLIQRCLDKLGLYLVSEATLEVYSVYKDLWRSIRSTSLIFDRSFARIVITKNTILEDVVTKAISNRLKIEKLLPSCKNNSLIENYRNIFYKYYNSYRKVKGDGNCYYRAVMFSIIESYTIILDDCLLKYKSKLIQSSYDDDMINDINTITTKYNTSINRLFDKITKSDRLSSNNKDILNNLKKLLLFDNINNFNAKTKSQTNILSELINVNDKYDQMLILACRYIIADYLISQSNKHVESTELSLVDIISANFDLTIDDFINDILLYPNRDAEDIILFVSSNALDSNINIWLYDDNQNGKIRLVHDCNDKSNIEDKDVFPKPIIHLLLRSNHYDIIYPNDNSLTSIEVNDLMVKDYAELAINTNLDSQNTIAVDELDMEDDETSFIEIPVQNDIMNSSENNICHVFDKTSNEIDKTCNDLEERNDNTNEFLKSQNTKGDISIIANTVEENIYIRQNKKSKIDDSPFSNSEKLIVDNLEQSVVDKTENDV